MSPRAVVVAHREAMVAEGIAAALARYPSIIPIAVATTATEAELTGSKADVVAIDALIPGAERATYRLRRKGVRVVLLADGPTGKEDGEGVRVSTKASVASLARALVPGAGVPGGEHRLTARQREVLDLVAGGFSGKQVARRLGISPKTVERHKTRIYDRLGVPNQTAAVVAVLGVNGGRPWIPSST